MEPAISVKSIIYDYPGRRALKGLSFDVLPGSVTSIVGPNGAGKTTLLKCIAALLNPLSGSISIGPFNTEAYPRECHAVTGFVADFFGLYEKMTVGEFLAYFAYARRVPNHAVRERVGITARQLGLSDRVNEKAGTLSRGMRQRLGIAQAIIHEPKVLLLDEPASGLDPEARHSLSKLITRLSASGMTVLVSSHILHELKDYSTDVIIMHKGSLVTSKPIGTQEGQGARIRVQTAGPPGQTLSDVLHGHDDISSIDMDQEGAGFTFGGGRVEQAALLRLLVGRGIEVSGFSVQEDTLQDEYMRHVEEFK